MRQIGTVVLERGGQVVEKRREVVERGEGVAGKDRKTFAQKMRNENQP